MRILLTVSLMALWNCLSAQHMLIEYAFNNNGEISKCELITLDSIAIWKEYSESTIASLPPPFCVKNYNENVVYLNEGLFNQLFYIKDSLHSMKWELTNQKNVILNEQCFSAKTNFRGRSYTAFYAPSIASSDGPWKFGGLPGLILAVQSDDNIFQYSAVKIISNFMGKLEKPDINKHKYINWMEYIKTFTATIDNYVKLVRSNGTLEDGSKAKLKITAPEIIYPKAQTGDGIEF